MGTRSSLACSRRLVSLEAARNSETSVTNGGKMARGLRRGFPLSLSPILIALFASLTRQALAQETKVFRNKLDHWRRPEGSRPMGMRMLYTVWERHYFRLRYLCFKRSIKKKQKKKHHINSKIPCPQSPPFLVPKPCRLREAKRAMGTRMAFSLQLPPPPPPPPPPTHFSLAIFRAAPQPANRTLGRV